MTSAIGERGMTLAELTLVGAILGLIAMLCWPSLHGFSQRISARADNERTIAKTSFERELTVIRGEVEKK